MGKSKNKPPLRVRWKTMEAAIGMEIREHKGSFAVYVVPVSYTHLTLPTICSV